MSLGSYSHMALPSSSIIMLCSKIQAYIQYLNVLSSSARAGFATLCHFCCRTPNRRSTSDQRVSSTGFVAGCSGCLDPCICGTKYLLFFSCET
ncbi:hypothetical protein HanPSC8_Chr04g0150511 [Helianthus annuus]|nr:hypothetical protein HanPSC8_Chr04g0150511 [Helianthus annuus]